MELSNSRSKDLTEFQMGEIHALHVRAHWGYKQIARNLNLPINTVKTVCHKFNSNPPQVEAIPPQLEARLNCGRKRKSSPTGDNKIIEKIQENPFRTAVQIKNECTEVENLSVRTIQRRLVERNYKSYTPAKKPVLSGHHKNVRFCWAEKYLNLTLINPQIWNYVSFSDESKFDLSSTSAQYVHRLPCERYNPINIENFANKSKGSVMVWGAFSYFGYTPLVRVDHTINSSDYISILQSNIENIKELIPPQVYFSKTMPQFIPQRKL